MSVTRARILWIPAVALVLAVSTFGLVSAAIPHSVTKLYAACITSTGSIRVIDHQAGKRCKSSEKTITWNQRGPAGAPGVPGADGVSGHEVVTEDFTMTLDAMTGTSTVDCPDGKVAIGGGYDYGKGFETPRGEYGRVEIDASYPTGAGWAVNWYHETAQNRELAFSVYAVCVSAS